MVRRTPPPQDTLTAPQALALAALLEGQSTGAAATAASVDPATVATWRETDAAFAAALRTAQARAWADFQSRAAHLTGRALEALAALLEAEDPKARLAAARAVLALAPPPAAARPVAITPEALERQWAREATARQAVEDRDEMLAGLGM